MRPPKKSPLLAPNPTPEHAEVIPFHEARERSRKIKIARAIASGTYKPNLSKLADVLLSDGLTCDGAESD